MVFQILLVLFIGACTGSFLNTCIERIPAGRCVAVPPSHCEECGHRLGFVDLVPVLSYIYLRGRCRWCGAPLPLLYPLVELLTAVLFVLTWSGSGFNEVTLAYWVFVSILVVATGTDLRHQVIPNRLVITGTVFGLPLVAVQSWETLWSGVAAFGGAGLFMLALAAISRGGMGGGDIKLSALMGLYLGPVGVTVALFLAFLLGGLTGIVLLVTRLKRRQDTIPFGPFLALGGIIALLWGGRIVDWYVGLLI